MIPKNIYQLTTRNLQLDKKIFENIENLKKINPDFQYMLMNEEHQIRFLNEHYSADYMNAYKSFSTGYDVAKMDFFRYLLMYQLGGVYLDIKSSFLQPFNSFITTNDTFLVSKWPLNPESPYYKWGVHLDLPQGEYINGVIISESHNPILKKVIEDVMNNIKNYRPFRDGTGARGVHRLTGPVAYTRAIEKSSHYTKLRQIDFFQVGYQVTIYSSTGEHQKLAKRHYAQQRRPILKSSKTKMIMVDFFFLLKMTFSKFSRSVKF